MQKQKTLPRVVVYINPDDYKALKKKLFLQDRTVSEWFREKVKQELKGDT